jgi:hypothetical protein
MKKIFFIFISCLFFHRMIIQSNRRLEFPVRLDATCCSSPPFLPGHLMEKAPRELNSRMTDLEWSTSMRTLQSVATTRASIFEEFRLTIRRLNVLVFAPRGLYFAIELVRVGGFCGGQQPVLVIGLTPEECDLIRMGTGFQ